MTAGPDRAEVGATSRVARKEDRDGCAARVFGGLASPEPLDGAESSVRRNRSAVQEAEWIGVRRGHEGSWPVVFS